MLQQVAGHNLLHRELGLHGHLSVSAAALVHPHDQAVLILCLLHHVDLYAVSETFTIRRCSANPPATACAGRFSWLATSMVPPSVTAPVWGYSA